MEFVKNASAVIALVAAAVGLGKGLIEYIRQGKQKRIEYLFKKQAEFWGNAAFSRIRAALENQEPDAMRSIPFEERRAFVTFLEEVALLVNSGLVSEDLAYYFFGYYAAACLENEAFWADFKDPDLYWNVFQAFARRMQARLRRRETVPTLAA